MPPRDPGTKAGLRREAKKRYIKKARQAEAAHDREVKPPWEFRNNARVPSRRLGLEPVKPKKRRSS